MDIDCRVLVLLKTVDFPGRLNFMNLRQKLEKKLELMSVTEEKYLSRDICQYFLF